MLISSWCHSSYTCSYEFTISTVIYWWFLEFLICNFHFLKSILPYAISIIVASSSDSWQHAKAILSATNSLIVWEIDVALFSTGSNTTDYTIKSLRTANFINPLQIILQLILPRYDFLFVSLWSHSLFWRVSMSRWRCSVRSVPIRRAVHRSIVFELHWNHRLIFWTVTVMLFVLWRYCLLLLTFFIWKFEIIILNLGDLINKAITANNGSIGRSYLRFVLTLVATFASTPWT